MEKIFRVMHAANMERAEFVSYYLKYITYQWYEKWCRAKADTNESSLWEDFTNAFFDHFFPYELMEKNV